ncbi:MAG: Gfo/Idh/MocA family oxidoreductase [Chloroflexi bacterium]|nr:Gfo/Idh/MocA family oxidoreductase [Chloroflexota bacterium]
MVLRLGIVDCDTSHAVAFTERLNHAGVGEAHWVDGARVVAAISLPSLVSPERVPRFTARLRELDVELVERPEDLLGKIDAVLIESGDGNVHRERAMPFIEAGVPTWIDKPFTCSTADARALVAAARAHRVPLLSASAARFDLPVQDVLARRETIGRVLGVDASTGAATHPRNPGFFHYAVHGVEAVYALPGAGCRRVRCVHHEGTDVAVGEWVGGRLATVRGIRRGAARMGFVAFAEKEVIVAKSSGFGYWELLKAVVRTFETGESPVSGEELIEVVAFQEAVLASMARDGAPVAV